MLEDKAIDKGRIVEVVFEHLALFAIDDAESFSEKDSGKESPESSSEVGSVSGFPTEIDKIISNTSYILNENDQDQKSNVVSTTFPDYRVVTLNQYFSKFLKCLWFEMHVKPMLHKSVLNGLANISHFIQLENLLGEDFKGLYNKELLVKLMNRSILKCGIIRTFGVVMPPNYPGIDFLIPFLIDDSEKKFKRPLYSFIAFQSKASKTSTSDCAYKMAASLHLINCPHANHNTIEDCAKAKCAAGFTQEEIEEICAHQVVVLLSAKNDEIVFEKGNNYVASKDHKISGSPKSSEDKQRIQRE